MSQCSIQEHDLGMTFERRHKGSRLGENERLIKEEETAVIGSETNNMNDKTLHNI